MKYLLPYLASLGTLSIPMNALLFRTTAGVSNFETPSSRLLELSQYTKDAVLWHNNDIDDRSTGFRYQLTQKLVLTSSTEVSIL